MDRSGPYGPQRSIWTGAVHMDRSGPYGPQRKSNQKNAETLENPGNRIKKTLKHSKIQEIELKKR